MTRRPLRHSIVRCQSLPSGLGLWGDTEAADFGSTTRSTTYVEGVSRRFAGGKAPGFNFGPFSVLGSVVVGAKGKRGQRAGGYQRSVKGRGESAGWIVVGFC